MHHALLRLKITHTTYFEPLICNLKSHLTFSVQNISTCVSDCMIHIFQAQIEIESYSERSKLIIKNKTVVEKKSSNQNKSCEQSAEQMSGGKNQTLSFIFLWIQRRNVLSAIESKCSAIKRWKKQEHKWKRNTRIYYKIWQIMETQNFYYSVKLKGNTREIDFKKTCARMKQEEAKRQCPLLCSVCQLLNSSIVSFFLSPSAGTVHTQEQTTLCFTHTHKVRQTTDPLWNNRSGVSWQISTSLICTFCL